MSEGIVSEIYFFLQAALTGVILSMVYDAFRILRRVRRHGWLMIAVEDFFYWIGSTLYIFFILMRENNGIIRWFFVAGILLGMIIYNITVSQYVVGILSKIIGVILNVVEKILKALCKPVGFLVIKNKKIYKKAKKTLKNYYKTIRIGLGNK